MFVVFVISELMANPLGSGMIMAVVIMIPPAAIFLNRFFDVAKRFSDTSDFKAHKFLSDSVQVAVIVSVPFILAAVVYIVVDNKAKVLFEEAYLPVIMEADQHIKSTGSPPVQISYRPIINKKTIKFSYLYNKETYAIETDGPSIDIDGSTIYYFAKQPGWHSIHNDHKYAIQREDSSSDSGLDNGYRGYMTATKDMVRVDY